MQVPIEIGFHNIEPSASVETEIRERIAKLERLFDGLIRCRVSIEALHHQHQVGNPVEVHIEMSVPGRELAVSREPHKANLRYQHPDVYQAVRDAFKAAERQLKDYKEQLREPAARRP
jgi:ribosome-associated translation inhibitor RaiA